MDNKKTPSIVKKIKELNPVTLVVAISLIAVLIFGIVLGTVLIVRNANTYVSLNGLTFNKGVCSYFASSYKTEYIASLKKQGVNAFDTESFWQRKTTVGDKEYTYGGLLKINTVAYLKGIIVGNYLFDRYGKLTDEDKAKIDELIRDTLEYKASSSKKKFNELSSEYGFDYSDFCDAVEYKYKAEKAKSLIYGDAGSSMSGNSYEQVRNEYYYENYSRVMLVFVRTNTTFVVGDNGNLVITTDEYGNNVYEMRELSADEIAERSEKINEVKGYIDARNNGEEGETSITPDYLSQIGTRYPSENNKDFVSTGYYLAKNSAYTRTFPIDGITDMALSLPIGGYAYTEYDDNGDGVDDGVCFMVKMTLETEGYSKKTNEEFFTDFYYNLSAYHYAKTLEDLSENVVINDRFYEIDLISLPYNSLFGIKF